VSRRSPTNARYQKNTLPAGQTRKSSAAAKPSRKGGAAPAKSSTTKSSKGVMAIDPPTEEFKAYRRQWWMSLVAGLVLVAVSFAIRTYGPKGQQWVTLVGAVTLGLAYAAIFYALYIDWSKMRPMRTAWNKSGKLPASPKAEKAEKAAAEKSARAEAAASESKTISADTTDSDAGDAGDKS
jgi:hypothetical protein